MKYLPTIAGTLLGLLFIAFSSMVLFKLVPIPPLKDDGSLVYHFMIAFGGSGYLIFVKIFELLGGILVAIPRTRNLGLLVLGPIIINILAFHALVMKGGLVNPVIFAIVALPIYLLWVERRAFLGLVRR